MAINSTINKVTVDIADMDRQYYQSHELTLAQHPSETVFRFMIRLLAFVKNAHEYLTFTKGLCQDEEPELWQKNLTDEIELWIEFGQADEKRIRKACGRAKQVIIYCYHEKKAKTWWQQQQHKLQRFQNLTLYYIDAPGIEEMYQRSMHLQCSIQDGTLYLSNEHGSKTISFHPFDISS